MKYLILAITLAISVPGTAKAEHKNDKGAVINNELANPY